MSEVLIPYGKDASDTANSLLAAAEVLELDPGVVRHQPDDGGFRVPEEVAEKAGMGEPDEPEKADDETADEPPKKKTTAKKTAKKSAKKSASQG